MKMPSRNKLLMLSAYLLVIAVILTIYHRRRISTDHKAMVNLNRIKSEISNINNNLSRIENARKNISSQPQLMVYIESLYRIADENRLKYHEVTTESGPGKAGEKAAFTSTKLKITIKGDFRSVAEYVRTVLNQPQLTRIGELKVTTDKDSVVGNIAIELFHFK